MSAENNPRYLDLATKLEAIADARKRGRDDLAESLASDLTRPPYPIGFLHDAEGDSYNPEPQNTIGEAVHLVIWCEELVTAARRKTGGNEITAGLLEVADRMRLLVSRRPAGVSSGGGAAAVGGKAGKVKQPAKKRGAGVQYDEREDAKIFKAYTDGDYRKYADCARDLGGKHTGESVGQAVDRHKHRLRKQAVKAR